MLHDNWDHIKDDLIASVDEQYGVFDGRTFSLTKFATYLAKQNIPWECTDKGRLTLENQFFRDMAKVHPQLQDLHETRTLLSKQKLFKDLAIGSDGRNRTMLSPFGAKSGRNTPSNSRFIFGPSCFIRSIIRPEPGRGISYIDWSAQEIGIMAVLSGDTKLLRGYESGDPYINFGIDCGRLPKDATKETHGTERERFKQTMLATQYGMGFESLSRKLNIAELAARELLRQHRETYPQLWEWADGAVNHAFLAGWLEAIFGWRLLTEQEANPRTMRNFLLQGNGAEMLRLACALATEAGIEIVAPIHDAVMIESPAHRIEEDVARMREIMAKASEEVLKGFRLRTSASTYVYPRRYRDDRGVKVWRRFMNLVRKRRLPKTGKVVPQYGMAFP